MDDDEINGAINGERDDDVIFNDDKINDDTYGADGTGGSNDNWIQPVSKMRLNDDMVDSNEFDDDMVSSRRSISSVDSSHDQLQDDDNNFTQDEQEEKNATNFSGELEGCIMSDSEMVLIDRSNRIVYSGTERLANDDLKQIGTLDTTGKIVLFEKKLGDTHFVQRKNST